MSESAGKESGPKSRSGGREKFRASDEMVEAFETKLLSDEYSDREFDAFSYDERMLTKDKDVSPDFPNGAEGKRLKFKESERLFAGVLKKRDWPPAAINTIIDAHIRPLSRETARLHRKLDSIDREAESGADADESALAKLAAFASRSSKNEKDEAKKAVHIQIAQLSHSRLQIMRNLVLHPEQFGIDVSDFEKTPSQLKLTTEELQERLENTPFDQCFMVSGRMMTPASIRNVAQAHINAIPLPTEEEPGRPLIIDKCLGELVRELQYVSGNKSLDVYKKHMLIKKRAADIAQFLADLTLETEADKTEGVAESGQRGFNKYANLILTGEPSDVAIDFPNLRLGVPLEVQQQMAADPKNASAIKFDYYRNTMVAERYTEADLALLERRFKSDRKEDNQQTFFDRVNNRVRKPMFLRSAEMAAVLENGEQQFSHEVSNDLVAGITSDAFRETHDLLQQLRGIKDKKSVEARAILSNIVKIERKVITEMKKALDPVTGKIMAFASRGAHKQLLIEGSVPEVAPEEEIIEEEVVEGDQISIQDVESLTSRLEFFTDLQGIHEQSIRDECIAAGESYADVMVLGVLAGASREYMTSMEALKSVLEADTYDDAAFNEAYSAVSDSYGKLFDQVESVIS